MKSKDFVQEDRYEKAMAAAMDKVMKQKADIDARNAEMSKTQSYDINQKSAPQYSEDDYRKQLQFHDWFYDYSDDHRMWQRGSEQRRQIDQMQRNIDPDYSIWNSYAPEPFKRQVSEQDSLAKQINWPNAKDNKPKTKKKDDGIVKKAMDTVKNIFSDEEFRGEPITEEQFEQLAEKQDACYHKVKSRYKVWPSAYASGALVKCRKVGAKNWGNSKKK